MSLKKLKVNDWAALSPVFDELLARNVADAEAFKLWLHDISDMEAALSEDLAWRYIHMTCDTEDPIKEERYLYFVNEIQPHVSLKTNALNLKIASSPFLDSFQDEAYRIYFRRVKNDIELFREENVPLQAQAQTLSQKYGNITGSLMVQIDGKEMTLPQAGVLLKATDRAKRQEAFEKIAECRLAKSEELDRLLDELIEIRQRIARNAGFANFRDYMHQALGRFDYTVQDCLQFHETIAEVVVPLARKLATERKEKLGYGELRPWDGDVDVLGRPPLKPFADGKELAEKTERAFTRLNPQFGEVITALREKGQLDLESRKGKAPGGYNYPLAVTGYPFIFMNSAGTLRDLETMVHEGGHAIHSVLTKDLALQAFKDFPSEVAELASMSMELNSTAVWDEFFTKKEDLQRGIAELLEGVVQTLPWIATVDAFQHWLYTHDGHTANDRLASWQEISSRFSTGVTDWTGYEQVRAYQWQRQLHIYEVPFYYIEYGFAQLGALGVWRNYRQNASNALEQYTAALSLGYTRTLPKIYETAGVEFGAQPAMVKELFSFLENKM